jgi:hypothetical protein
VASSRSIPSANGNASVVNGAVVGSPISSSSVVSRAEGSHSTVRSLVVHQAKSWLKWGSSPTSNQSWLSSRQ